MNERAKYQTKDLTRLLNEYLESICSDEASARQYLSEQGKDTDEIVKKGLKRIKKIQLQIEAQRTKEEMCLADKFTNKAIEWVEKLLAEPSFSFINFARSENLAINFCNIESLSKEDIKQILLKHFTLKLMKQNPDTNTPDGF